MASNGIIQGDNNKVPDVDETLVAGGEPGERGVETTENPAQGGCIDEAAEEIVNKPAWAPVLDDELEDKITEGFNPSASYLEQKREDAKAMLNSFGDKEKAEASELLERADRGEISSLLPAESNPEGDMEGDVESPGEQEKVQLPGVEVLDSDSDEAEDVNLECLEQNGSGQAGAMAEQGTLESVSNPDGSEAHLVHSSVGVAASINSTGVIGNNQGFGKSNPGSNNCTQFSPKPLMQGADIKVPQTKGLVHVHGKFSKIIPPIVPLKANISCGVAKAQKPKKAPPKVPGKPKVQSVASKSLATKVQQQKKIPLIKPGGNFIHGRYEMGPMAGGGLLPTPPHPVVGFNNHVQQGVTHTHQAMRKDNHTHQTMLHKFNPNLAQGGSVPGVVEGRSSGSDNVSSAPVFINPSSNEPVIETRDIEKTHEENDATRIMDVLSPPSAHNIITGELLNHTPSGYVNQYDLLRFLHQYGVDDNYVNGTVDDEQLSPTNLRNRGEVDGNISDLLDTPIPNHMSSEAELDSTVLPNLPMKYQMSEQGSYIGRDSDGIEASLKDQEDSLARINASLSTLRAENERSVHILRSEWSQESSKLFTQLSNITNQLSALPKIQHDLGVINLQNNNVTKNIMMLGKRCDNLETGYSKVKEVLDKELLGEEEGSAVNSTLPNIPDPNVIHPKREEKGLYGDLRSGIISGSCQGQGSNASDPLCLSGDGYSDINNLYAYVISDECKDIDNIRSYIRLHNINLSHPALSGIKVAYESQDITVATFAKKMRRAMNISGNIPS